ncbi:macro domain-containing protein [Streptomyces globosus]|uniref:type II toxin-antitoxin system antitoxin DNA ADP-ribosyl glycohydrolase DarG n=1 Tax=Streptomyces globosus TaxID=68209 RepID=UPI00382B803C
MHGLVNTVNTVGVMGKGIALSFKRKYPDMYQDYVRRCNAGLVRLGRPYPYNVDGHVVVNFPTKGHWRSVSRLADIIEGLDYLLAHYREWGVKSLAVPPLGCGNGQLEWSVVAPTLMQHLAQFDIPVELYAPFEVKLGGVEQLNLWDSDDTHEPIQFVSPWQVALVEILNRLERQPYRWPVGRVMFQKVAYFATMAGIPTDLEYERASYGPFSSQLKPTVAKLQNNGLIEERQRGSMFEVRVGRTFQDARAEYREYLEKWDQEIEATVDLAARFDSVQAEIAATVHYSAAFLTEKYGRRPTASEVLGAVEAWKVRRKPPLNREDVLRSIVHLATLRWISVQPDESVEQALMELTPL